MSKSIEERVKEILYYSTDDITEDHIKDLIAQAEKEARKPYEELLYAVETKHPEMSRHETALYYIQQAEQGDNTAHAQLSEEFDEDGSEDD